MFNKVLVLSPHTDDGELGCGGTITKLIEEGSDVYYAAFSVCELSIPNDLPKNILEIEVKNATKTLGLKPENLFLYKYGVRTFPQNRQSILDDLIKLREKINPDLVLMPCINDIHQDHHTISEEGIRAFKKITLLGYEMPWNNITINTQSFFVLEERHVQKKAKALSCYKSQESKQYTKEEFIRNLATIRGVQIGTQYAEVFEVIRCIFV